MIGPTTPYDLRDVGSSAATKLTIELLLIAPDSYTVKRVILCMLHGSWLMDHA